ncbi:MAG: hypothetical protein KBC30_06305 [Planctomycetes bacterium]|jgi:hypothetical protein|nr:hypothetical protein [Planctomycetota bacterium]HPY74547.1 hypothetical protein [Planctomycetota bacterium]HQB00191.1 hypothetical protein [Planctomycetota bacterium]
MKKYLYIVLLFCLLCGIGADGTVPQLTLTTFQGKEFVVDSHLPRVILFFDSNVVKTEECLKVLYPLQYAYHRHDVVFVGIHSDLEEINNKEKQYLSQLYPDFCFCIDPGRKLLRQFKSRFKESIAPIPPFVLVVNRKGQILDARTNLSLDYMELWNKVQLALGYNTKQSNVFAASSLGWSAETQQEPKIAFVEKTEIVEENVHDDAVIEDTIIEDTVIEDTIIEDKDTVIEDTISKDTIEDTIIEDTIEDISETLPVETPSTETPLQEMDKEEIVKTVSSPTGRVLFPCLPEAGQRNLKEKYIVAISNFAVMIAPLLICFWGMLFALAKQRKYAGIIWGFWACFLYFSWSLFQLYLTATPNFLNLYFPCLVEGQTFCQKWMQNLSFIPLQKIIIIVCQFLFIGGLVHVLREEKVVKVG